jgi:hypothetical protein
MVSGSQSIAMKTLMPSTLVSDMINKYSTFLL